MLYLLALLPYLLFPIFRLGGKSRPPPVCVPGNLYDIRGDHYLRLFSQGILPVSTQRRVVIHDEALLWMLIC